MTVYICREFLCDLRSHGDIRFASRVLQKVVDASGEFSLDANDHRYRGIENAWIRYVSRGSTAYRVIYIRAGRDIYLYRAGEHSIEREVGEPRELSEAMAVAEVPGRDRPERRAGAEVPAIPRPGWAFLKNFKERYLRHVIAGRRLAPHRSVVLVTPFVSAGLLVQTGIFGRLLDDWVEDGAKVTLITLPALADELRCFEDLEVRGVEVLFHSAVHAKLYLFEVDPVRAAGSRYENFAVVGSANLTKEGFCFDGSGNEELCYELPADDFSPAMEFAIYLSLSTVDLQTLKIQHARQSRQSRG